MLNKKSVDDINVKGKKVLVRCDFNVPLKDGKITDENRLVAALPTIKKLIADGGKVILCSHLGKPKGEPKPELSLAPVAVRLSELLGQEVKFAADPEVVGPNAKAAVEAMKDGEVVLLENTRYRAEETKNGEAFSKDLASLCDVFVNDAFGTAHRAHCSNVGVTEYNKYMKSGFVLDHKKINAVVDDSIKKLRIKTPSMKEHIANLSGGNQQKVIVSRWLANDPDVLIMDEPTRGIDVGAKHEIYEIMNDLAKQGKAIIMISSEMAELLGMSDRVCVMCNGRLTGEITEKEEMSQANVMQFATQF